MKVFGFRYDRLSKSENIAVDIYSNLIMKHDFNPDTLKIIDIKCGDDMFENKDMFYVEVQFEGEQYG